MVNRAMLPAVLLACIIGILIYIGLTAVVMEEETIDTLKKEANGLMKSVDSIYKDLNEFKQDANQPSFYLKKEENKLEKDIEVSKFFTVSDKFVKFGKPLEVNTLVFDVSENKLWKLNRSVNSYERLLDVEDWDKEIIKQE